MQIPQGLLTADLRVLISSVPRLIIRSFTMHHQWPHRLCTLIVIAGLVAASAHAQAPAEKTHHFERSALSVTLQDGFSLENSLEEHLPDHAVYLFVDDEGMRTVAVEVHAYFDDAQRTEWLAGGEIAVGKLSHLDHVEPVDPSGYSLAAGSAYTFSFSGAAAEGVSLFGCDEKRCYRASVTAPVGELDPAQPFLNDILTGIRFTK